MFKFTDRAPEPYLTDGECGVYDGECGVYDE
jgi:hypothetical protein